MEDGRMHRMWEAIKKVATDRIAELIVVAIVAGVTGIVTTLTWFRTAIALNDVVSCVANVKTCVAAVNEQLLNKKPDRICFSVHEPYDKLPWRPRFSGF